MIRLGRHTWRLGGKPGFLLLEALVAIAVVSCMVIVVSSYQVYTMRAHYDARMQMQALSAARNSMETLVHAPDEQLPTPPQGIDVQHRVRALAVHADAQMVVIAPPALELIEVTANYTTSSGKQALTLMSSRFKAKEQA